MELITSVQNQFVKIARGLSDKKNRDENGLFLAEGINLLRDMPSSVKADFFLSDESHLEEAQRISSRFSGAKLFAVADSVMKSVSGTVSPYGIVAAVHKPTVAFAYPTSNALVLDRLSDAGNVGTILRSAAAQGYRDVYLYDCVDVYSPKVVRASLGGIFKLNLYEVGFDDCVSVLTSSESFALDMDGEDVRRIEPTQKVTLLAGSEAHGISDGFKAACKKVVSIPMKNEMESLNVAVATSIAMFEFSD